MEYVLNANLPNDRVQYVIISEDCPIEILYQVEKLGIKTIKCIANPKIVDATKSHPDMNIVHLGKNRFICAEKSKNYYANYLKNAEFIVIDDCIKSPYPMDAALNVAILGEHMFLSLKTANARLREELHLKEISVKQGYTKCNIAPVTDSAILTEDVAIYKEAIKNHIDAFYIESGSVSLKGFSHGFIGGACGKFSKDILACTGKLSYIKEHADIRAFCRNHGVEIIELSAAQPCDIGSILPIAYK